MGIASNYMEEIRMATRVYWMSIILAALERVLIFLVADFVYALSIKYRYVIFLTLPWMIGIPK